MAKMTKRWPKISSANFVTLDIMIPLEPSGSALSSGDLFVLGRLVLLVPVGLVLVFVTARLKSVVVRRCSGHEGAAVTAS